ncbi:conserved hypothetical protein [Leishmania major strain Friedlin]|uniref:Uncharacterized protein n=1 Tax=Leishmania major TaxID=5664 RepID=Q4Q451_LEIMA|nr:conserved hypothetical protein [Leishmania major strain Friedlin]CAG9580716.1 hypothetical_protein_-_conserved [Leishmania major strain Friedlin]CAJ06337.1 conserved hypothetical protein [Leishmania major strain Friedlin]|eukprot:XP_001685897.1 conserved hypothetical protein [Leishmania major strain Friedlin]
MTMYRQWYHDELERVSKWAVETPRSTRTYDDEAQANKDDEGLCGEGEVADTWADSAGASPVTAMEEWDLYVCLVSGAGAGSATHQLTAPPPSPSLLSPDVRSWVEELVAPFDSSSTLDRQGEAFVTGPAHWHASTHRRQQQRDYAEQHIHFRVVHSPNELLAFLEHLGSNAALAPSAGAAFADAAPSIVPPVPLVASQQQPSSLQLSRSSSTTTARGQKRRRSPRTAVSSSSSVSPSCGKLPQRTWRLQRQRLLLLDGLDALWLHPSLGNHCATHTGQWFAEELHRRLRAVLLPRLSYAASNSAVVTPSYATAAASPTSPYPHHTLYSTVVFTNGCNGSSRGILNPQQLEARLAGPVGGAEGWTATLPRPSGNAVWCRAADTRCLVEPAHPGLVSLPTPSSSYVHPARVSHGPGAMRQSCRGMTKAVGPSNANSRESLVTVVKGGSCVAATWVLRDVTGGEQET